MAMESEDESEIFITPSNFRSQEHGLFEVDLNFEELLGPNNDTRRQEFVLEIS